MTRRAAEPALERALAAEGCPAVVAPHASGGRELLCAVIDAADRDPLDVAAEARKALIAERGAGAGRRQPRPPRPSSCATPSTRRAARWRRPRFANGHAPEVASWRDLGAFTLLLSIQDDDALGLYCDSVLGPIEEGDEDYGGELLRSLEAFIEQNGQWERAARQVYCHRHTLRYRMRKVEELTGRDLSRAHDRIEFWLALRARELVKMKVGVPKEIKSRRVPRRDHPGRGSGDGRARPRGADPGRGRGGQRDLDARFEAQGARIVPDASTVFAQAEMILHVKELQAVGDRDAAARAAALHLPAPGARPRADPRPARLGRDRIAYETVEDADGRLPLLAPMSEIAGKIATQAGAFMLENPLGGRGILLGGVPGVAAANVMVIGGGVVGMNAAFIAIGMEADVFVFDQSIDRLRELEVIFGGRCSTVYSTTLAVEEMLPRADLVIGAVLVHGARAPYVVRREQLALMKPGAVLVDVAIDQGGCFETSRPTTHRRADLRGRRDHPLLRRQHARRGADHLDPRADQRDAAVRDRARRPRRRRGDRARSPACGPASTSPRARSPTRRSPRVSAWTTCRSRTRCLWPSEAAHMLRLVVGRGRGKLRGALLFGRDRLPSSSR